MDVVKHDLVTTEIAVRKERVERQEGSEGQRSDGRRNLASLFFPPLPPSPPLLLRETDLCDEPAEAAQQQESSLPSPLDDLLQPKTEVPLPPPSPFYLPSPPPTPISPWGVPDDPFRSSSVPPP
ncbi:amyloid beta A4 precursor protein-binding family B member 1-interacting protein-like [Clupea harengus]|uniref:Amyloid beta A4 precursor protein-binding family B member 1-interacting protein-like n=1 Tax=Clupea harengus TaxID=7950 RepID=A0A8M1KUC8_CLUHA|nr:amyloid beta A4 precursor protein-binding family B member 1-interacting protein-like [Clupea harengus]